MYCERVKVGEMTAIICRGGNRRRRACVCGKPATRLCDWVISRTGKRAKTCSAPICEACTTSPAPGKDLCPIHGEAWARHPKNPHGAKRPGAG